MPRYEDVFKNRIAIFNDQDRVKYAHVTDDGYVNLIQLMAEAYGTEHDSASKVF